MGIRQDRDLYNIGAVIQKIRISRHLSQQDTVNYLQRLGLDTSRQYYSQIERGIANIRVEILLALCQLFDCQIQDFFSGITLVLEEDDL